jgi:hypothetical protein
VKSAWEKLKVLATCCGIVGFLLTIIILANPSEWASDHKILLITHALYLTAILFLIYELSKKPTHGLELPKIKIVKDNGLILAENANWLSVGTVCAVYVVENEFEIFKHHALVTNIQENDLVQIQISDANKKEDIDHLQKNQRSILVKPGVSR